MRMSRMIAAGAACLIALSPAVAQLPLGLGSGSSSGSAAGALGGLTGGLGLAGGALPSLSSTSTGNAAGVLSYCVKNKILGGSGASSALGALTGKSDVTSSSDYSAGESGSLITGQGKSLSLSSLPSPVKTKLCNLVLQHAQSSIL